mgnify:CR=1 FL=1
MVNAYNMHDQRKKNKTARQEFQYNRQVHRIRFTECTGKSYIFFLETVADFIGFDFEKKREENENFDFVYELCSYITKTPSVWLVDYKAIIYMATYHLQKKFKSNSLHLKNCVQKRIWKDNMNGFRNAIQKRNIKNLIAVLGKIEI